MHRLFVAIRPPEDIRDLLIDAMDDSADFRWQDDEQLHLTLRFIGEVERPIANDIADALTRVAAKIERTCIAAGLEPEHRAYHPHITLARWKGRRTRELAAFLDRPRGLSSPSFEVTEFGLFESRLSRHGAHYEKVASFPLE